MEVLGSLTKDSYLLTITVFNLFLIRYQVKELKLRIYQKLS